MYKNGNLMERSSEYNFFLANTIIGCKYKAKRWRKYRLSFTEAILVEPRIERR